MAQVCIRSIYSTYTKHRVQYREGGTVPGKVNWTATFEGSGDVRVRAELYDSDGKVVVGDWIPCDPPICCPFAMEDVAFGTYTAALVLGNSRYYYAAGQAIVSNPGDIASATAIEVSQSNPIVAIEISASA